MRVIFCIYFASQVLIGQTLPGMPYLGVTYVSHTEGELPVSYGWRPETDGAGARAITKCVVAGVRSFSGEGSLECDADLVGGDPRRNSGGAFVDLRFSPPFGTRPSLPFEAKREQCEKGPLDLRGQVISVRVFCPRGSAGWPSKPNGLTLFAKAITVDSNGVTQYPSLRSKTFNVREDAWNLIELRVPETTDESCGEGGPCADGEFDPRSISLLSLQFSAGGESYATYFGKLWIDEVQWGDGVNPKYGFEFVRDSISRMKDAGVDAVSLIVTWYTDDPSSTVILPDEQKTHRDEDLIATISRLKREGIRVLLKPHVDLNSGGFRGDIYPLQPKGEGETEAQRKPALDPWFRNYRAFILRYAQLAIENGAEAFSVGTELNRLTDAADGKAEYWREFITEIRRRNAQYKNARGLGEPLRLTFAANWDAFDVNRVAFWGDLDFIGIDAYFPLSNLPDPSEVEIQNGWTQYCWPPPPEKPADGVGGVVCPNWLEQIRLTASAVSRPVIFTELGFRNVRCAAKEPASFGLLGDVDGDGRVCRRDETRLNASLTRCLQDSKECLGSLNAADVDGNCKVDQTDRENLTRFLNLNATTNSDESLACVPSSGPFLRYQSDADLQARAYRATATVLRAQPWFTGWFWWAWEPRADAGGSCNMDFTPQNKLAEKYVARPN